MKIKKTAIAFVFLTALLLPAFAQTVADAQKQALAKHPDLQDEFWAHNTMMMIRAAHGDPAAALAENDQATLCAARGTWNPEDREVLA